MTCKAILRVEKLLNIGVASFSSCTDTYDIASQSLARTKTVQTLLLEFAQIVPIVFGVFRVKVCIVITVCSFSIWFSYYD